MSKSTKRIKGPGPGHITVEAAAAYAHWDAKYIRAKCEAGEFPPGIRWRDDWIVNVKRMNRWLGKEEAA